jgi:hypothetical protein
MKIFWIILLVFISSKSNCEYTYPNGDHSIAYSNSDIKNYLPLIWDEIHNIYSIGDSREKLYEKLLKIIQKEGIEKEPNKYYFHNSKDTLKGYYRPLIIDDLIEGGMINFTGIPKIKKTKKLLQKDNSQLYDDLRDSLISEYSIEDVIEYEDALYLISDELLYIIKYNNVASINLIYLRKDLKKDAIIKNVRAGFYHFSRDKDFVEKCINEVFNQLENKE